MMKYDEANKICTYKGVPRIISTNPSPIRRITYFVPNQSKDSTTISRRALSLPEASSCLSRFSTRMEPANLARDAVLAVRSQPTEKPMAKPARNAMVVAYTFVRTACR